MTETPLSFWIKVQVKNPHLKIHCTWSISFHTDAVPLFSSPALSLLLQDTAPLHGQRRRLLSTYLKLQIGTAWFGLYRRWPFEPFVCRDLRSTIGGLFHRVARHRLRSAKLVHDLLDLPSRMARTAAFVSQRRGAGLWWWFWRDLRSRFGLGFEGRRRCGPLGCFLDRHGSWSFLWQRVSLPALTNQRSGFEGEGQCENVIITWWVKRRDKKV